MGLVAVAINSRGSHVGLLYRLTYEEPVHFLHLAWDHALKDEPFQPKGYFAIPLLTGRPVRAKQVAQYCHFVSDENRVSGIPYSFTAPFDYFDERGTRVHPESSAAGLTCASFVVSVLEQAGIRLFRQGQWRWHCDDHAFFRWIIRALKGEVPLIPPAARSDHPAAVEAQMAAGAFRYRPAEVAGAACSDAIPVTFTEANVLAEAVRRHLPRGYVDPDYYG
jgi:hypothetical protein